MVRHACRLMEQPKADGEDEADQKDKAVREASRPDGRGPGASDQQRGSFLHAYSRLAGLEKAILQ